MSWYVVLLLYYTHVRRTYEGLTYCFYVTITPRRRVIDGIQPTINIVSSAVNKLSLFLLDECLWNLVSKVLISARLPAQSFNILELLRPVFELKIQKPAYFEFLLSIYQFFMLFLDFSSTCFLWRQQQIQEIDLQKFLECGSYLKKNHLESTWKIFDNNLARCAAICLFAG